MTADIKSRLLKMPLKKLSSHDFDTPKGKKRLYKILNFFIVGTIENNKIKKSLTVSKHFNFPFLFTPPDPKQSHFSN